MLPNRNKVADTIRHYHELGGYVGASQVLAVIMRQIHVLHGRSGVGRVGDRSAICGRESVRPYTQQMAPLPFDPLDMPLPLLR